MTALEFGDIQADVAVDYLGWQASYRFYEFRRAPGASVALDRSGCAAALRELAARVTTNDRCGGHPSVVAGLSASGLRALRVPDRVMATLPTAFVQGMRARAAKLGDDLTTWDPELRDHRLDLLVMIRSAAADPRAIARSIGAALRPVATLRHVQHAHKLGADGATWETHEPGFEHFGFRDGVSNPVLEGSPMAFRPGDGVLDFERLRRWTGRRVERLHWRRIRPGEFLLGYPDELEEIATGPLNADLLRNGSYLVWRKLRQDVDGFRQWCRTDADIEAAERLVGRRRDGSPLVPPRNAADGPNGFDFRTDATADECPAWSHIRRSNPRAGIDLADGVVHRHRLVRRSMPYTDGEDRGLIFVSYQADIARQFEFVQQEWLNAGRLLRIADGPDALSGGGTAPAGCPVTGFAAALSAGDAPDLPSFVTPAGGEYFLVPGRAALGHLARALETP